MDQIREQMDRLSDLSPEELDALKESVVTEFEGASGTDEQTPTRETVDLMNELADANDAIVAEQDRRAEEAQELSAAASEAASRMKSGKVSSEEDEDLDPEAEAKKAAEKGDEDEDDDSADDDVKAKNKKKDEKLKDFSTDSEASESTNQESPVESEASTEEVSEPAKEQTELSTEEPAEAEAAKPEAELSAEENIVNPESEVAELATNEKEPESSEEPVTASNTPEGELEFKAPEDNQPTLKREEAKMSITASADFSGISAGSSLPDRRAVAQAILDRKKGMGKVLNGDGDRYPVARFAIEYPEARTLSSADTDGNRQKILDVIDSREAITAAGGLTAPVETSYDIWGFDHSTARPVRDSLAVFNADRGGIRFMTPPVLADVEGAVSVWTLEDDIAAVDDETVVKPCIRINAGEEVIVYTDAIPLCLTFGNLGARAYPELVERHTELAMVWHARFAETRLLTRIGALSTPVTAGSELGAARDFFVQLEQAAAAYRSRHRIDPETSLRVILPLWFKNALRADLTKQIPGDGQDTVFNLSDSQINGWFASRNVNVTWTADGEEGQVFGPQTAGTAAVADDPATTGTDETAAAEPAELDGFPDTLVWYLFSEGTFLFLDNGTLDLGIVRDSTLNSTNDYKLFLETFEGVAKIGIESLRVTTTLAIRGSSSATSVVTG